MEYVIYSSGDLHRRRESYTYNTTEINIVMLDKTSRASKEPSTPGTDLPRY